MPYIDASHYQHALDRQALDALKSIPGFTALLKAFMKVYNERIVFITTKSTHVQNHSTPVIGVLLHVAAPLRKTRHRGPGPLSGKRCHYERIHHERVLAHHSHQQRDTPELLKRDDSRNFGP